MTLLDSQSVYIDSVYVTWLKVRDKKRCRQRKRSKLNHSAKIDFERKSFF